MQAISTKVDIKPLPKLINNSRNLSTVIKNCDAFHAVGYIFDSYKAFNFPRIVFELATHDYTKYPNKQELADYLKKLLLTFTPEYTYTNLGELAIQYANEFDCTFLIFYVKKLDVISMHQQDFVICSKYTSKANNNRRQHSLILTNEFFGLLLPKLPGERLLGGYKFKDLAVKSYYDIASSTYSQYRNLIANKSSKCFLCGEARRYTYGIKLNSSTYELKGPNSQLTAEEQNRNNAVNKNFPSPLSKNTEGFDRISLTANNENAYKCAACGEFHEFTPGKKDILDVHMKARIKPHYARKTCLSKYVVSKSSSHISYRSIDCKICGKYIHPMIKNKMSEPVKTIYDKFYTDNDKKICGILEFPIPLYPPFQKNEAEECVFERFYFYKKSELVQICSKSHYACIGTLKDKIEHAEEKLKCPTCNFMVVANTEILKEIFAQTKYNN